MVSVIHFILVKARQNCCCIVSLLSSNNISHKHHFSVCSPIRRFIYFLTKFDLGEFITVWNDQRKHLRLYIEEKDAVYTWSLCEWWGRVGTYTRVTSCQWLRVRWQVTTTTVGDGHNWAKHDNEPCWSYWESAEESEQVPILCRRTGTWPNRQRGEQQNFLYTHFSS